MTLAMVTGDPIPSNKVEAEWIRSGLTQQVQQAALQVAYGIGACKLH
jgi:hypothetical protein